MSWRIESGTGLEHKGSICAGAGTMDSAGALTAFGLDFERLTVGEVLPRGQKGNAEGSGDTYMSAVENVGEVDDIAWTRVEVGDEVNSALVAILCRRIVSMAGR